MRIRLYYGPSEKPIVEKGLPSYMSHCLVTALLIGFTSVCAYGQSCSPGPGPLGTGPRCGPNPVPCAQCTGTWTDNYGWTYNISSNNNPPYAGTYSVSGTLQSVGLCGALYQNSSGTLAQINGGDGPANTQLNITFSNPDPSGWCDLGNGQYQHIADTQTISVNITNDDCDNASGSWSNSDGCPACSGNLAMTKPSDIPDLNPAETTSVVSWWSSDPTIMLYDETIGSSKSLAGRQVFEMSTAPNDGCWYQDSLYGKQDLTGGGWFVGYYYFNNRYEYDYVGMGYLRVPYYRGQVQNSVNRTPCLVTLPQTMKIYTRLGSQAYFNDTLYYNLPDQVNYGVSKNNVQAWRTYP